MAFRPRIDEGTMAHIDYACGLTGIDRTSALKVLVSLGAAVLRSGEDPDVAVRVLSGASEGPAPTHSGSSEGPGGGAPEPQRIRTNHPEPQRDQGQVQRAQGPGPQRTGTEVALSSSSSLLREKREEERRPEDVPANWPWWDWDGSDDRLCSRYLAALGSGHSPDCCLTRDFLVHAARDIAEGALQTQRQLTAAQARSMRGAVRVVVGCEQSRRRQEAKARRAAQAKVADEQARKVTAPAWWLEQQERAAQQLERRQRESGDRRRQQPVRGDVAAALPDKSTGTAGEETE